jgi:hypothetical protein
MNPREVRDRYDPTSPAEHLLIATDRQALSTDGWLPFPSSVCSYFIRGKCWRIGCRYFHGTKASFNEHKAKGATHYRINDSAVRYESSNNPQGSSNDHDQGHHHDQLPQATNFAPTPVSARRGDIDQPGSTLTSSSSSSRRRSLVVCLSYLSGSCLRPECRFAHLRAEVRPLPMHVCAYKNANNSNGGCTKGHLCRYFHGPSDDLLRMKKAGVMLYNPFTNEPYDALPDQVEAEEHQQPPRPPTQWILLPHQQTEEACGRGAWAFPPQHQPSWLPPWSPADLPSVTTYDKSSYLLVPQQSSFLPQASVLSCATTSTTALPILITPVGCSLPQETVLLDIDHYQQKQHPQNYFYVPSFSPSQIPLHQPMQHHHPVWYLPLSGGTARQESIPGGWQQ